MKQRFFIPGPLPGLNDFVGRASKWEWNAAKKRWAATIGWEVVRQKVKPMGRVYIRWIWQEKDQRRDPDNVAGVGKKFILDTLVKAGILPNDGWKNIAGWSDDWVVVKDTPGVTVELEEVEEG